MSEEDPGTPLKSSGNHSVEQGDSTAPAPVWKLEDEAPWKRRTALGSIFFLLVLMIFVTGLMLVVRDEVSFPFLQSKIGDGFEESSPYEDFYEEEISAESIQERYVDLCMHS